MAKKKGGGEGHEIVLRSEGGGAKNFRDKYFFASAPLQVFVNGPLAWRTQIWL